MSLKILIIFLLFFFPSCKKKEKPVQEPRAVGAYHGYKPGSKHPGDPDYHKGLFPEKIAESPKHPDSPQDLISQFTALIKENPKEATYYLGRGSALALSKDYVRAIEDYEMAIKLSPQYAEAYSNLGFALFDLKEFDRAEENQKKAIALYPKLANAYYGLALIYEQKGLTPEAIKNWEEYLKLSPENSAWRDQVILRLRKLTSPKNTLDKK